MSGLSVAAASVADVAAKATLVLCLALVLAWLARRGSARTLHLLWTTTFAVLLALPVLDLAGPSWTLPVLPVREIAADPPRAAAGDALAAGAHAEGSNPVASSDPESRAHPVASSQAEANTGPVTSRRPAAGEMAGQPASPGPSLPATRPSTPARDGRSVPWSPAVIAFLVWALGCGAALTSLGMGVLRFRRLVRQADPVPNPAWIQSADALRRRLRVRARVRILSSPGIRSPMTGGLRNPAILLPAGAQDWPPGRRAVVLAHELVHVRRLDPMRQLLGGVVVALYWFHPLSWLASRLATTARELSCDEEVLALGARPSDYARHLLSLASQMTRRPAPLALSMAHHSKMENRMMSILRPSRPRYSRIRTFFALAVTGGAGIIAACANPVPREPAAGPAFQTEIAPPGEGLSPITQPVATAAPEPAPAPKTEPKPPASMPNAIPRPTPNAMPEPAPNTVPEPTPPAPPSPDAIALQELECDPGNYAGASRGPESLAFQTSVDGMRLCMRSQGRVRLTEDGTAVRDMDDDGWLLLQSRAERVHRLLITSGPGGLEHEWSIDGRPQPFDARAREWRDRMLTVLARSREALEIRGGEAGLRGITADTIEAAQQALESIDMEEILADARDAMADINVTEALEDAARALESVDVREALEAAQLAVEEVEALEAIEAAYEAMEDIDWGEMTDTIEAAMLATESIDVREAIEAAQSAMVEIEMAEIRSLEVRIEELDADRRADEIERSIQDEIAALRRLIG